MQKEKKSGEGNRLDQEKVHLVGTQTKAQIDPLLFLSPIYKNINTNLYEPHSLP